MTAPARVRIGTYHSARNKFSEWSDNSMVKPQKVGKNIRMSFSKIDEPLEMPSLIEIQKESFNWFVKKVSWRFLRTFPR